MSKFQVGDEVIAVGATYGWGGVKQGDVGVITPVRDKNFYQVDFPRHPGWNADEKDLQLVYKIEENE